MFQFSIALRKDLEVARTLAGKRELQKLRQAQIIHEIISNLVFPLARELRSDFERIMAQIALVIWLRYVMVDEL